MSGFPAFQPLQLPTAVGGTLFKDPEVREGKKGYFVTGKLKVAGGGFCGFISFNEDACRLLGDCTAGTAVMLSGFVKAGRPYASNKTGEMIGTLDLTVEYAELLERSGDRNIRNERGTAPPRQAAARPPRDEHGDVDGNSDGRSTHGADGEKEEFDDEIPF